MNNTTKLNYETLAKKLDYLKSETFQVLERFKKNETAHKLESILKDDSNRKELKVAFVGQYNAGKSTIISALTGRKDIKIDSNVATDVSSEYNWNNIIIVDTPGILAGKVEHHDTSTKATLSSSDLIVYTLTSQLFDDIIFENFIDLAYTQKLKDKMIIAINKMSMEKGEFNDLKMNYTESIKTVFKEKGYDFDFKIIFMDAFDYIEGVDEEEEDLIEMSNFDEFIQGLNELIEEKGLIHKAFDTPIRLMDEEIGKIAIDETDPSFGLILKKYENRFRKYKKDLNTEAGFIYNELRDKVLSKGYNVSSLIGDTNEEEFNRAQNDFQKLIEKESMEATTRIETLIKEKSAELGEELSEINQDDDVALYTENLQAQFEKQRYQSNVNESASAGKIDFLETMKGQAASLAKFTGTSASSGILAKSGEVAGSQGHKVVYQVGKLLGQNFKPYGAVNIAKNIGNVAKFAGPVLSVVTLGLSIRDAAKEEKQVKKIMATKNQINNSYLQVANDLVTSIDEEFKKYIKENVDAKLEEYNQQKIDIASKSDSSSKFITEAKRLKGEYVEFIELISK